MNIHEYRAKSLLRECGVARTPEEAEDVAKEFGGSTWLFESRINVDGRHADPH